MQYLIKADNTTPTIVKCSLSDHFVSHIMGRVAFVYKEWIPDALIIQSLKKVLGDFPIFAGVLRKKDHQLYIDCQNQGVELRVVHHPQKLADLQLATNYKKLVKNVNPQHLNIPVLYMQLNYCPDGLIIGYCWHHSIGDMASFMAFLHALSSCAQGQNYLSPPRIEDREAYLQQFHHKKSTQEENSLKIISFMDILQFVKHKFYPRKKLQFYLPDEYILQLKTSIEMKANTTFSKNNIICSFLLDQMKSVRVDENHDFISSVIINYRKKVGMSPLALGNYLDVLRMIYNHHDDLHTLTSQFNVLVEKYMNERFDPASALKFLNKIGGFKKIKKIIPREFLPKNKNFVITSWLNFNIYSIDFGVRKPSVFLSLLNQPLPWTCSIVEGFENKGALISIDLPANIAKKLRKNLALFEVFH